MTPAPTSPSTSPASLPAPHFPSAHHHSAVHDRGSGIFVRWLIPSPFIRSLGRDTCQSAHVSLSVPLFLFCQFVLFIGFHFKWDPVVFAFLSLFNNSVGEIDRVLRKKEKANKPWLVCLSGLSTSLRTKGWQVRFPVRAHAWVAGQVPCGGCVGGSHTLMFLSLSLPLSKNKYVKSFKKWY